MADDQDLNERLTNLERFVIKTLGQDEHPGKPVHPAVPVGMALFAIMSGYLGLGLPQHYYQPVFAALIIGLTYHRQTTYFTNQPWRWLVVVLNFIVLCFLMKFLIGGGVTHPFSWLQVPTLSEVDPAQQGFRKWLLPKMELKWDDIDGVTRWQVDITRVQSLFLVFTLAATLMRFQVFASMSALLLLVISVPTLFNFNWQWVIWFLVATTVCFYLQSQPPAQTHAQTDNED